MHMRVNTTRLAYITTFSWKEKYNSSCLDDFDRSLLPTPTLRPAPRAKKRMPMPASRPLKYALKCAPRSKTGTPKPAPRPETHPLLTYPPTTNQKLFWMPLMISISNTEAKTVIYWQLGSTLKILYHTYLITSGEWKTDLITDNFDNFVSATVPLENCRCTLKVIMQRSQLVLTHEIIHKLFKSFLQRYQVGLES